MSEHKHTEEEYADMVQCYLTSNEDLNLTQICYEKRYPGRTKPTIETLEEVLETYLEAFESNNSANPEEEVTEEPSNVDDSIVQYFINNPHATVKKAASIFCVLSSYIEKLLEERKVEIEAKPNEDEEIIREEQNLNDYLKQNWKNKKTTATKVKQERSNYVDKTIIVDEIDSEESNIETIIGSNESINLICNEDISSQTQDFAISCETSNSGTETCSENTMNEMQGFANYSETKHSETDDDVICCEIEHRKKRKKNTNCSGTKKLRTSEKRKRKSSSQDLKTLESTRIYNAIVYTTRLEEMSILHKKIKRLDNALVIKKILLESRPQYNCREQKSNIASRRTMSFKLLKNKLKKFKSKEKIIDLTEKNDTIDDEDLVLTDVIYPQKITTKINAEDTENVGISKKINVVIVINNLFSNLCDIYITDWKCNITEYHCTKLNDKIINQFDPSKIRLILDACCWFRRQHKVELIWPRNECSFFRFLTTTHKCPLNQCSCCCKPKEQTTDITLCKSYDTDKLTDNLKTQSHEINKSLILSASTYKKPDTNQNTLHDIYLNRKNGSNRIYLFRETLQKGENFQSTRMTKNECFEIINNQDIIRFHADTNWRVWRQHCNHCQIIAGYTSKNQLEKVSVCCSWKRDSFLFAEYKACKISASALRFLRKKLFPNFCDQCKKEMISPDINLTPNLIIDKPKIEHTRTFVQPTLLKIGDKSVAPDVSHNSVRNLAYQILKELKLTQKTSPTTTVETMNTSTVETINPPSTVKLKITCYKVLGLDFEIDNVDYQTATNIVNKITHMNFTVKEDLKVVLNTSMKPISNEEFQVIARILLNTQNCLKLVPLPPGSVIDLVAKIIENQSYVKSLVNENKRNDGVGQPLGTCNNIIKKSSRETYLNVVAAFKNCNYDKPYTEEQSNTNSLQNKSTLREEDKIIEFFDDYDSNQNTAYKYKNKNQSSAETSTNENRTAINKVGKTNEKYSSHNNFEGQGEVHVISHDVLHTGGFNICEPYDCFANVINRSKKCYLESFKSYLKLETDFNLKQTSNIETAFPKISNVFSLQSPANQIQIQTSEPMPSTSKDVSDSLNTYVIPSIGSNETNILNNINPYPIQPVMLYDPTTEASQLVYLSPNLVNLKTIMQTQIINPKEPMTLFENNSNIAVLTPINQVSGVNMPEALKSVRENSILRDRLSEIPRKIDERDLKNCETVVKAEVDDDVIVLDSD